MWWWNLVFKCDVTSLMKLQLMQCQFDLRWCCTNLARDFAFFFACAVANFFPAVIMTDISAVMVFLGDRRRNREQEWSLKSVASVRVGKRRPTRWLHAPLCPRLTCFTVQFTNLAAPSSLASRLRSTARFPRLRKCRFTAAQLLAKLLTDDH